MTELGPTLTRLGLHQYLQALVAEGFDTWETLCDITESDLAELDVKLGHRRKLQREIAISRGLGPHHALDVQPHEESGYGDDEKGDGNKPGNHRNSGPGGKRKYRRHPKPDENAPERAPSAYVIFSNKVREDVKHLNLSFTDIAKRVGEQWQQLSADVKASYESQAAAAKEKYRADLAEYKKTDKYREYNEYLANFKLKNATRTDEKRPRLDTGARNQSSHSAGSREDSSVDPKATKVPPGRRRADSLGSLATYSSASSHPSPVVTAVVEPQPTLFQVPTYLRPLSSTSNSPPSILSRRDMTMPYHQGPPKLQSAVDSVQELSVRATAMESREPHCSSAHLAGFPYDSDPSGNRESNSPSTMAQRVNQESSRSSNSSPSPTHSGYPAASSSQTSSTTDNRSQRTLPPLAAIKPGDKRVPFAPDLSSSAAPPAPYLRLSFSSTNSPTKLHGSTALTPNATQLPPLASPQAQSQVTRPSRFNDRAFGGLQPTDLDPSKPSFKGEYEPDIFPASDADPLSVLAYAGRMVDQDSARARQAEKGRPKADSTER